MIFPQDRRSLWHLDQLNDGSGTRPEIHPLVNPSFHREPRDIIKNFVGNCHRIHELEVLHEFGDTNNWLYLFKVQLRDIFSLEFELRHLVSGMRTLLAT